MKTERALIEKLKEYIKFLSKIVSNNAMYLHIHNINASKEEIETGIKLRDQISALEEQMDKEEMPVMPEGRGDCPDCNGFGYTAEHDPYDPHSDGECSGGCPIQVECQKCKATGWINFPVSVESKVTDKSQQCMYFYDGNCHRPM
jgi:hypothetical protein